MQTYVKHNRTQTTQFPGLILQTYPKPRGYFFGIPAKVGKIFEYWLN